VRNTGDKGGFTYREITISREQKQLLSTPSDSTYTLVRYTQMAIGFRAGGLDFSSRTGHRASTQGGAGWEEEMRRSSREGRNRGRRLKCQE
jgi:hypothetical protein